MHIFTVRVRRCPKNLFSTIRTYLAYDPALTALGIPTSTRGESYEKESAGIHDKVYKAISESAGH